MSAEFVSATPLAVVVDFEEAGYGKTLPVGGSGYNFPGEHQYQISHISIGPSTTPPEHHSYALEYLLSSGALLTGIVLLATSDDHRVPPLPSAPAHRIGYGVGWERSSLLRSAAIVSSS